MALLLALRIAPAAQGAGSSTAEQVINEVAQEMTECAAYFAVLSVAMDNSRDQRKAEGFKAHSDNALGKALIASREAGLKDEVVSARFEMAIKDMGNRIGMNTSNISILMADYNDRCVEAMTDANKRLQYWRQRLAR